jgi:hypothetical protein
LRETTHTEKYSPIYISIVFKQFCAVFLYVYESYLINFKKRFSSDLAQLT